MRLRLHDVRLLDQDLWACAREALPEHRSVLVELTAGGCSGWGEAAQYLPGRYNSATDVTRARLAALRPLLAECKPGDVWDAVHGELADAPFALAALDSAAHDLAARLEGVPLHRHLDLAGPVGRHSSYSIGLAAAEVMEDKLRRAPGWKHYKIKLSHPDDLHVLRLLRAHTTASFWIDGNAAWQPSALLPVLDQLADLGVTAVEQPYPVDAVDAQRELRRVSPIPIFADESIAGPADLERVADVFHGVNVKVLEAGGVTPAVDMLRAARRLGLATMLGCVPESSAGASIAAHLAALADHLDLDTAVLLAADTGTGVRLDGTGRVLPVSGAGSGFRPDFDSPCWLDPSPRTT